ncbi:hypothetical protein RM10_11730 [Salmonella enterica]|nr:hypothetical protein [Salmonella enterica]
MENLSCNLFYPSAQGWFTATRKIYNLRRGACNSFHVGSLIFFGESMNLFEKMAIITATLFIILAFLIYRLHHPL